MARHLIMESIMWFHMVKKNSIDSDGPIFALFSTCSDILSNKIDAFDKY